METIREFIPASTHGAVIITSQNPEISHMTTTSIPLQPLLPEEGSKLIQNYLNRGDSEKDAAQRLASSLGGLPLAIVHFTGYLAKSQAPIDHITKSLDKRLRSSQVWKADVPSSAARAYQFTLSTVWHLAIERLSPDARTLLEFIAFLDPDQISVDLFVGDGTTDDTDGGWVYWDLDRQVASSGFESRKSDQIQI
jgi:hypothetical protein